MSPKLISLRDCNAPKSLPKSKIYDPNISVQDMRLRVVNASLWLAAQTNVPLETRVPKTLRLLQLLNL